MENNRVVIALGGNALGNDLKEQQAAAANTAKVIVDLIEKGYDLVITHGNGPQVGMIRKAMNQYRELSGQDYEAPLPSCVAMSQGYIGIDLQNAIKYELYNRKIDKKVSTIISQVEVDPGDEAFKHPSKPIGSFMTKEEAKKEELGIICMEDAGRGYREVVASPMPQRIRELETIKTLMEAGHVVITCGGGGIPVINQNGRLMGANAVIDKDNVSSLLAQLIDADYLVILTAVEKVAINFGKENQMDLSEVSTAKAKDYMKENQFAKGSMLPKIEAAVRFVESSNDRRALITLLDKAQLGLEGKTGTVIHR